MRTSVRHAVDGWAVPAPPDLTITAVEPIGNYAVRLAFSDGHDRGIYPWAYLIEIDVRTRPRRFGIADCQAREGSKDGRDSQRRYRRSNATCW